MNVPDMYNPKGFKAGDVITVITPPAGIGFGGGITYGGKYVVTCVECGIKFLDDDGVPRDRGDGDNFNLVSRAVEDDILTAEQQPTLAPDFLQSALVHMKERAITYDNPQGERSMKSTVEAFKAITGIALTEEKGWLLMAILKLVRSQQGEYKSDSYEDGCSYFALMGEAANKARNNG